MGLIIEIVGNKLSIGLPDDKILNGYLHSSTDILTTLGALVVLFPRDELRWSIHLFGSNGESVVHELSVETMMNRTHGPPASSPP